LKDNEETGAFFSRNNTKMVKYRGANDMTAYQGRPAELKRYPTNLLSHDNCGLDNWEGTMAI
jgi:hypothetical protein